MALFKPIRRISSELSAVEKRNGQFLIATDTGEAFVDISDSERLRLNNKSTPRTLITPVDDLVLSKNELYWWINDIGDFVLRGKIILDEGIDVGTMILIGVFPLKTINIDDFEVLYLPCSAGMQEGAAVFMLSGKNEEVSELVVINKGDSLTSVFFFNCSVPTLGKVVDNNETKYLV